MRDIVPGGVAVAEIRRDVAVETLWPQERAAVARAVESRQREYATGRWCVREALGQLGVKPVAVLSSADRSPMWPQGIVGSITHCPGYRAAAVAWAESPVVWGDGARGVTGGSPSDRLRVGASGAQRTSNGASPGGGSRSTRSHTLGMGRLAAIGIDAEPAQSLSDKVLHRISLDSEGAMVARLTADHPEVAWSCLLFSAKESVYKAWYPLTKMRLDFSQAEVGLRVDGTFSVRILREVPSSVGDMAWQGTWAVDQGLALTSVVAVPLGGI